MTVVASLTYVRLKTLSTPLQR